MVRTSTRPSRWNEDMPHSMSPKELTSRTSSTKSSSTADEDDDNSIAAVEKWLTSPATPRSPSSSSSSGRTMSQGKAVLLKDRLRQRSFLQDGSPPKPFEYPNKQGGGTPTTSASTRSFSFHPFDQLDSTSSVTEALAKTTLNDTSKLEINTVLSNASRNEGRRGRRSIEYLNVDSPSPKQGMAGGRGSPRNSVLGRAAVHVTPSESSGHTLSPSSSMGRASVRQHPRMGNSGLLVAASTSTSSPSSSSRASSTSTSPSSSSTSSSGSSSRASSYKQNIRSGLVSLTASSSASTSSPRQSIRSHEIAQAPSAKSYSYSSTKAQLYSEQVESDEEREKVSQKQRTQIDTRQIVAHRTNRIRLHVYDLISDETVMQLPWGCHFPIGQCFNAVNSGLHTLGTGAYHVGIEVSNKMR